MQCLRLYALNKIALKTLYFNWIEQHWIYTISVHIISFQISCYCTVVIVSSIRSTCCVCVLFLLNINIPDELAHLHFNVLCLWRQRYSTAIKRKSQNVDSFSIWYTYSCYNMLKRADSAIEPLRYCICQSIQISFECTYYSNIPPCKCEFIGRYFIQSIGLFWQSDH